MLAIGHFIERWGRFEKWLHISLKHEMRPDKPPQYANKRITHWAKLIRNKHGPDSDLSKRADKIRDSALAILETRDHLVHSGMAAVFEDGGFELNYETKKDRKVQFIRYTATQIHKLAQDADQMKHAMLVINAEAHHGFSRGEE